MLGRGYHLFVVVVVLLVIGTTATPRGRAPRASDWPTWIKGFGHDVYQYPQWIKQQMNECECKFHQENNIYHAFCYVGADQTPVVEYLTTNYNKYVPLNFCVAKQWLLDHMPEFDKYFLPPSVSVTGVNMLDDNIAFALMADAAASWSGNISLALKLAYILPYSSFPESRSNWRPLLFSKYFSKVANAKSTTEAIMILALPNDPYTNWTNATWPDYAAKANATNFFFQWASSTSPPVSSPFDFAAYGYGSCTAWSTLLAYVARSVGIPARQVGTPCWNAWIFAGLATQNPNVSRCWHGGDGTNFGDFYLYNHNWVEYWDNVNQNWAFMNVPCNAPNTGFFCSSFSYTTGCGYSPVTGCKGSDSGAAHAASRDHEIFSLTWHYPSEATQTIDGGPIIDVKTLTLSNGEPVSPIVWAPNLASPLGIPLKNFLRVVNRTDFYRCREPTSDLAYPPQ